MLNDNLFVTFNAFLGGSWQRALVFRFPLATLASGGSLGYRWWTTTSNGSLRLTRGSVARMYFGSHNTLSQIRVFEWADNSTSITQSNVNVRSWSQGAYSAPGPGGVNWLARVDGRITGAWVARNVIGFMWSANRDGSHPLPYVRVVRLNEGTKGLIDQPDIWSNVSAWAYPAAAPNTNGQVGFAAFYGGGPRHPGHVVGARTASGWETVLTRTSTHSCRPDQLGRLPVLRRPLQPAGPLGRRRLHATGGTDRRNIEPRHVEFASTAAIA